MLSTSSGTIGTKLENKCHNIINSHLILAVCSKWGGKDKGLKLLEKVLRFFGVRVVKQKIGVGVIIAG